jgi:hypothetical protein
VPSRYRSEDSDKTVELSKDNKTLSSQIREFFRQYYPTDNGFAWARVNALCNWIETRDKSLCADFLADGKIHIDSVEGFGKGWVAFFPWMAGRYLIEKNGSDLSKIGAGIDIPKLNLNSSWNGRDGADYDSKGHSINISWYWNKRERDPDREIKLFNAALHEYAHAFRRIALNETRIVSEIGTSLAVKNFGLPVRIGSGSRAIHSMADGLRHVPTFKKKQEEGFVGEGILERHLGYEYQATKLAPYIENYYMLMGKKCRFYEFIEIEEDETDATPRMLDLGEMGVLDKPLNLRLNIAEKEVLALARKMDCVEYVYSDNPLFLKRPSGEAEKNKFKMFEKEVDKILEKNFGQVKPLPLPGPFVMNRKEKGEFFG